MFFFDYLTGAEVSGWDLGVAGAEMPPAARDGVHAQIEAIVVELYMGPQVRKPRPWAVAEPMHVGGGEPRSCFRSGVLGWLERYLGWCRHDADVMAGEYAVGWSQPPHPIDVIPSFDPSASKAEQARAVLYDYYHDDPLRYWADNEAVKRCFGVKNKEDYDPTYLITAYENPKHAVWQCHGDKMTWKDMDDAVQAAIQHRSKLGPLPASNYDTANGTRPIVIYYYDNDKMKRITYPPMSIPNALNPNNVWWWKWGQGDGSDAGKDAGLDDVHTRETSDPKQIAAERANPGWVTKAQKEALKSKYPWLSDMSSGSAGDWGSEGITWDKDMIGVIGAIVGAVIEVVGAVLDATGVGAVVGVPLNIAGPLVVAAINLADAAIHDGDFAEALNQLGPALVAAAVQSASKGATAANVLPSNVVKTLGDTINSIAAAALSAKAKGLDYAELWADVAKKAQTFGKLDDAAAHTLATFISGKSQGVGKIFTAGYEAGKLTDPPSIAAIAKVLQAWATFSDPRVVNLFLLGAGIGYVGKVQQMGQGAVVRSIGGPAHPEAKAVPATPAAVKTGWGRRGGALEDFCELLMVRYGGQRVGQEAPAPAPCSGPPDYTFPALGCPTGCWWDSLSSTCRPSTTGTPAPRAFGEPATRAARAWGW